MFDQTAGESEDVFGTPLSAARPSFADRVAETDAAARGVSAPVVALVAAVDAVLAQSPADLPGPQALTDTSELLAQIERLRGGVLGRIATSRRASSTSWTARARPRPGWRRSRPRWTAGRSPSPGG